MKTNKRGLIFNVGPLNNIYSGPHTYADVLFPFINELTSRGADLTWGGITVDNKNHNERLSEMGVTFNKKYYLGSISNLKPMKTSWDFVKPEEFDFLLCQPRPLDNVLENEILFSLINKFLDAGKTVFVWEQDMFTDSFTQRMRDEVIFLHPAEVPTGKFKTEIHFPFFTYTRNDEEVCARTLDFVFLGNIYGRQPQALKFFGQLNDKYISKTVFGSWVADEARREFSSQFDRFDFAGSTEHWASIPVMRRAKATLHIVPDFAKVRGLMTARVFTSHMAKCLCFCDAEIVGAEKYFPPELIVKDGNEIAEKWDYVQAHRAEILEKREKLMAEHTVEKRVDQFIELLDKYTN